MEPFRILKLAATLGLLVLMVRSAEDEWSEVAPPGQTPMMGGRKVVRPMRFSNVLPAPGVENFARGIDRFDGTRAPLPLFQWTYSKYIATAKDCSGSTPTGNCNEQQVTVGGKIYKVPDQIYVQGPNPYCESAKSSSVQIISSEKEMEESESEAQTVGMSAEASAYGQSGSVKMESGSSESSKEYSKSASKGETRSAFASITSRDFDFYLTSAEKPHPLFESAVQKLNAAGNSEDAVRNFLNQFGSDYMFRAIYGGKVTQQTSAKSREKSSVTDTELKEAASKSFGANFGPIGASGSKEGSRSKNNSNSESVSKSTTSHKARFVGGVPSKDWMGWCASTSKLPKPVSFQIRTITSLIRTLWKSRTNVADAIDTFLATRRERRIACEGGNSGKKWNKVSGKCEQAECESGSYRRTGKCINCKAGKYVEEGGKKCKKCQAGKFSKVQASSCSDCPSGKTSPAGRSTCDQPIGSVYIRYAGTTTCSLTAADSKGRGDNDFPDDGQRWAILDCNTPNNKLSLELVSGNKYYIRKGSFYLSIAGRSDGDNSKCYSNNPWMYWGSNKHAVTLERKRGSKNYYIVAGGKYATYCGKGDSDKQRNTLWINTNNNKGAKMEWKVVSS